MSNSLKILNVTVPLQKPVWAAVQYIYGIGQFEAKKICGDFGFHPRTRLKDLPDYHLILRAHLESEYQPRQVRVKEIGANILAKVRMGSYVGLRHTQALPVHGQGAQTNARTQKKLGKQRIKEMGIPAFNKTRGTATTDTNVAMKQLQAVLSGDTGSAKKVDHKAQAIALAAAKRKEARDAALAAAAASLARK
jgi:small subunit ribosomal protein S13